MKVLHSPSAPNPNGHYSQAILANGFVFLSGQLPALSSIPSKISDEEIELQVGSILDSFSSILSEADLKLSNICSIKFYTTTIDHWPAINRAFEKRMGAHKPSRTVLHVTSIKGGHCVMADAIAAK